MHILIPKIKIMFNEEVERMYGETWFMNYRADFVFNENRIAWLRISRKFSDNPEERKNDFWFNLATGLSRPVVVYHETEEEYRGRDIQSVLAIEVNRESVRRFGEPLVSDTLFCSNPAPELGLHPNPAKRIWEKLESRGLARYYPYNNQARWIMYS